MFVTFMQPHLIITLKGYFSHFETHQIPFSFLTNQDHRPDPNAKSFNSDSSFNSDCHPRTSTRSKRKILHRKTLAITAMIRRNPPPQLSSEAASLPKASPSPWWMRTPLFKAGNGFTTPPISSSPSPMFYKKYEILLHGTASISCRSLSKPWNLRLNHLKKVRVFG